jgi:hypothetical protein
MFKPAWSLVLALGCITPVVAQDSLIPTDISDGGEVTVTALLRYILGQGTLTNPLFDVDFDDTHLLGEIRVGVGLGSGFEIEGSFPFELQGKAEADEDNVEFETETAGLGDLALEANYRLLAPTKSAPSFIAGLVLVLPTGNDDFATPEIRINGVQVQDGEDGGLGQGVVKVGLQAGVDHAMAGAHIYALVRALFPMGTQEEDDLEIDHPEQIALVAGAMLPVGSTTNLDLRLSFLHSGDEIAEDDFGDESTEEAHVSVNLDARFYFTVGDTASLVLGGHIGWAQDHAVDEESDLELEDTFVYGVMLGVHLRLGVPLAGK